MTDRAEPGVTPLTAEERTRLHALHVYAFPTDEQIAAVRKAARFLDAATPRPGLVERIADALETIGVVWPNYPGGQYEGSQRDRAERTIAAALASGTGEPGLDVERLARAMHEVTVTEPGLLSDVDMLNDPYEGDPRPAARAVADAYARLANDKGADPTPEPK